MADKKFGQKRVCANCEIKFYDLNKKSPLTCPHCNSEFVVEEEFSIAQNISISNQQKKSEVKDEFADLENAESSDDEDEIISLDEAADEEEDPKG